MYHFSFILERMSYTLDFPTKLICHPEQLMLMGGKRHNDPKGLAALPLSIQIGGNANKI